MSLVDVNVIIKVILLHHCTFITNDKAQTMSLVRVANVVADHDDLLTQ